MSDPYQYFKIEAAEILEDITKGLLKLEKSADDTSLVKTLFRYAHTLKGAASVVRLGVISDLAHRVEDWLAGFRDHKIKAGAKEITLLLEAVDVIGLLLHSISEGKPEDAVDVGPIIQKMEAASAQVHETSVDVPCQTHLDSPDAPSENQPQESVGQEFSDAPPGVECQEPEPSDAQERKIAETVRINTEKMKLMTDFSNEIAINILRIKNLVSTFREGKRSSTQDLESMETLLDQLEQGLEQTDRFSQEMSDLVMDVRLVSVEDITYFFEKTVRELALSYDRKIEFTLEGGRHQVDRSLLAGIKEPIYHLLRNSVIHGVELPEERMAQGKPRQARIQLVFKKSGEMLEVICEDDGRGLDPEKIKKTAVKKKLMDLRAVEGLSDREVMHLIFESGFSSAETVTELAGRGVGLDVVKNTVKLLSGSIWVDSARGQYTRLSLKLPLSVNVVDAFMLEAQGHHLLLPMQHIVETRLAKESQIRTEAGRETLRFNGEAILLVDLPDLMKLGTPSRSPVLNVIFIRYNEKMLALRVNAILGRRRILLKPLPDSLKSMEFLSAVTIVDNGMPAFVLNVPDIFARMKYQPVKPTGQTEDMSPASVLVVDDSLTTRTLINSILVNEGYQVTLAQSSEDALPVIERQNFDLIISDVEMPGENGFEFTGRVRNHPKYGETPVMIMSSRGSDDDIRKGIDVGANAYIVKGSFDQKIFIETVESLI